MIQDWAEETLDKVYDKTLAELQRMSPNTVIPYMAENGRYVENMGNKDITWWTNGFWGGLLWQLHQYHSNKLLEEAAIENEQLLDQAFLKYQGLHHDVGFMWLPTAVAHYRLDDDSQAYWRGRHAADLLAGRYNPNGKYLRSWNRDRAGWVIIDSMINIQLLYWASDVTKDPRYKQMADNHAHTIMQNHVRADGSVAHIVVFDPNTGEQLETLGGQGYGVGSSWSRGQAWAIYGFALAYAHTKKPEYLETAKKVAHYFLANIENTGYIPQVDFRGPASQGVDTSAGVTAACGLLEIAKQVSDFEKPLYQRAAEQMLVNISEKYGNFSQDADGVLMGATTAFHDETGQNVNLVYGDYYFVEGLLRLIDHDMLIW
ncbi:D-glucuronyl C5-epimerase family protein [Lactiplantibacillus pentosus]|uniref:D-glucuronyl C5-epimerase family protein n=1 Tax=Lactiplantibacillus pentosus TaxID=1589 RepID=UPI000B53B432|nr:D-glucuronyl C5-epimerase family protein [Lactiplantibacillus pentosus]ASG79938.1 glycosyl hydrolase family 88 [Lactiplantibacillus pentosus]PRO86945.1 glycosyl hydrolase family 88 [Lactiplantibacillus pentosus]